MIDAIVRPGEKEDLEPAIGVWQAANTARRSGSPMRPQQEARIRENLRKPDAFAFVADAADEIIGVALGMQGRAGEGAGPPIPDLCHISMVFVRPDHWVAGHSGSTSDTGSGVPDARNTKKPSGKT
ncbi:MAG: hypothetical protein ACFB50_02265 [Rubrobacteraceae bacterium]